MPPFPWPNKRPDEPDILMKACAKALAVLIPILMLACWFKL